jgi:hypothetical protein
VVLAIEAIGPAAKPDELVELAVVIEIGPRVGLAAVGGEELGLNERELGRARIVRAQGESGYREHSHPGGA